MGGSTRTFAWLLLLAMGGGPLAATACEFGCLSAESGPVVPQPQSGIGTDGHGCHEAASALHTQSGAVMSTSPHAECSHGGASAPFVVAAKLSNGITADGSAGHAPTLGESLVSHKAAPPLAQQTPPVAPLSRIVPLRI